MAKNTPEVKEEQKVQTKYDRKMEARKQQKEKEQKEEKRDKFFGILIVALLVIAIGASIIVPIVKKNSATKDTYATIAGSDVTKLEYDYYYNTVVNNYVNSYSSLLPYLGLDTSLPFEDQVYVDNMTWEDYFDETTVDQIMRVKVLLNEAEANGFTYDVEADYETFKTNVQTAASEAGVSTKEYYQQMCGSYATEENMASFIKEGLLADAYYTELEAQYAPTDEEVASKYEENKQSYDQVDYRSFAFTTELAEEATDEEISAAVAELEVKAEAMKAELEAGAVFEDLCIQNAADDEEKAEYEDAETEGCLTEGGYYNSTTTAVGDWLFAEDRAEGDLAVIYDDINHRYFVVEFIQRYYDESNNESISSSIATEKLTTYLNEILESSEVIDVKGELNYLTIEKETEATESTEEAEETEATDTAE